MERKTTLPKDKQEWLGLRSKNINSTEVSALFGLSPYTTAFELYHQKKDGLIPEFNETERVKWGSRLESAIALGVAEDKGWAVRPMKEYIDIPALRLGSSFDFMIEDRSALIEVKNVDSMVFKSTWDIVGDNIEAPYHIELQAQNQMLVSGINKCFIVALAGGNTLVTIERDLDQDIAKSIQERVFEFWESIRKGIAPNPDFNRDTNAIKQLYNNVREGSVIKAEPGDKICELAEAYRVASEAEKIAKAQRQTAKNELLTLIGEANKVDGDGFKISAGMIGAKTVSYTTEPYRDFRISFKKEKAAQDE